MIALLFKSNGDLVDKVEVSGFPKLIEWNGKAYMLDNGRYVEVEAFAATKKAEA